MTAHFDKAFFPSLFAVSTTENGKKIFTGKARYAGLDGAGTPMACVNAILSRSKPKNVQTHACPHQNAEDRAHVPEATGHARLVWATGEPHYAPLAVHAVDRRLPLIRWSRRSRPPRTRTSIRPISDELRIACCRHFHSIATLLVAALSRTELAEESQFWAHMLTFQRLHGPFCSSVQAATHAYVSASS